MKKNPSTVRLPGFTAELSLPARAEQAHAAELRRGRENEGKVTPQRCFVGAVLRCWAAGGEQCLEKFCPDLF